MLPEAHYQRDGAQLVAMDVIEIRVDGGVFSADAVIRATHRYTADYYTDIASIVSGFVVRLTPMSIDIDSSDVAQRFRNDVLDEQLRERIRAETMDLHGTLVKAALLKAGTTPRCEKP